MLSNVAELDNLLDVLNQETIGDMTFDQCIQKFNKHFSKPDWFKACSTLCYLIEAQVSSLRGTDLPFTDAVQSSKNRSLLHTLRGLPSRERANDAV